MAKIKMTEKDVDNVTADHDTAQSKQSQLTQLLYGTIYYNWQESLPRESFELGLSIFGDKLIGTIAEAQGSQGTVLAC